MKRIALLLALIGLSACDAGVSGPGQEPVALVASVTGPSGTAIGAALFSMDLEPETVAVGSGWGLTSSSADRSIVGAVLAAPRTTLTVTLEVAPGTTPSIQLLQVSGPDDQVYPDPTAFTVELRERDGE